MSVWKCCCDTTVDDKDVYTYEDHIYDADIKDKKIEAFGCRTQIPYCKRTCYIEGHCMLWLSPSRRYPRFDAVVVGNIFERVEYEIRLMSAELAIWK